MLAEIIRHGRVDRAEQFFGLFVEIMRRHAHVIDDGALLVAVQQPDDAFLRIVRQQVLDLLGVGKPVVIVNISLHGFDVRGELVRIIHALRERDAVLRGLPDTLHRFDLRLDVTDRVAGGGAEEIGDAGDDRKHDKHAHDAQDIFAGRANSGCGTAYLQPTLCDASSAAVPIACRMVSRAHAGRRLGCQPVTVGCAVVKTPNRSYQKVHCGCIQTR